MSINVLETVDNPTDVEPGLLALSLNNPTHGISATSNNAVDVSAGLQSLGFSELPATISSNVVARPGFESLSLSQLTPSITATNQQNADPVDVNSESLTLNENNATVTGVNGTAGAIFSDNFETYTNVSQLTSTGNYDNFYNGGNVILSSDAFQGSQSLLLRMPSGGTNFNAVEKDISDRDEVFARVYTKYQAGYQGVTSAHEGIRIQGRYTSAGSQPDGTDFFLVAVEVTKARGASEPGEIAAYVYHPEMNDNFGAYWFPDGGTTNDGGKDASYFGSSFVSYPSYVPTLDTWIAYEVRVRMNTPGLRDGLITVWADGSKIAEWTEIRFRDVGSVQIDSVQLEHGGQGSTQQNDKFYDNFVIGSSYIGLPGQTANVINAASTSRSDVQSAINLAEDGDIVLIPDGSSSWTSGISTTKQILIKAENITEAQGGTMSRNVTITSNAGSTPIISMTSGDDYHVGVFGIRFDRGSGDGNYINFSGDGSKVPLVGDCGFEFPGAFGNNPTNSKIAWGAAGGVVWNCYFDGDDGDQATIANAEIFADSPRAWQTASTMGMDDVNGDVNLYIEDCTCFDVDAFVDGDRGARVVLRNNVFDGTWFLTHGFTSGLYQGGRHVEVYDNEFKSTRTDEAKNLAGRYFWLRAGTCVITDNDVAAPVRGQDYGDNISVLEIGDNTTPSGSQAMQPGWGHDGTTDIREPMYVWGNTGFNGSRVTFVDSAWSNVTSEASSPGEVNAELFVDLGAKPGWTKYPYPHPFRSEV